MKTKQKTDYAALGIFMPSVLAAAIIPVIMFATLVTTRLTDTFRYFGGTANGDGSYMLVDIYSQGKAFATVCFAVVMLVLALVLCIYLFKHIERRSLVYAAASMIYVVLTFISALSSRYSDIAFYGQYDRAEGFYTIACYFVMFLFTMYAFKKMQNFRYIMFALFFAVGVNVIIGLFQFTGNNLMYQEWFRNIVVDRQYASQLVFNSDGITGSMYGALYHYNYVGSFCGLIVPVFSTMLLFDKSKLNKILFGFFDVAALFLLFGSSARSGIVAIAAAVVVGIIVFARVIIKRWKISVCVVAGVAVLAVGANLALDNALFSRIPTLFSDIIEFVQPVEDADLFSTQPVREILHKADGSLTFVTNTDEMNIRFNSGKLSYDVTDKEGNSIPAQSDSMGNITFTDEDFEGITLLFNSLDGNPDYNDIMYMWFYDDEDNYLTFRLYNRRTIHMIDPEIGDRLYPITAESIGFEGKELVGSSRGYIWSRTFPLLEDCIYVGYGPDTFAYTFPQNDYIAKNYAYAEGFNITVDKPHNLYIQIAMSSGFIALFAFLAIALFYLVDCFRLYALKKDYRAEQICGISIMLGVVGYLAAGFFNDSAVSVAPVFWILLGVGCAVNTINRRMDKEILIEQGKNVSAEVPSPKKLEDKKISSEDEQLLSQAEKQAQILLSTIKQKKTVQHTQEETKKAESTKNITKKDIAELAERARKLAEKSVAGSPQVQTNDALQSEAGSGTPPQDKEV